MNLENNTDKIKKEIKTGNEILRKISCNISELNKNISNNNQRLILFKEETKKLNQKYQSHQNTINILKLNINKKQFIVEKRIQNNNLNNVIFKIKLTQKQGLIFFFFRIFLR